MSLYICQTDLDRLVEEACEALPEECCGLLVGRRSAIAARVERTVLAENIATGDKTSNYQIDWRTLFNTIRQTRGTAEEIVGFFHSHPDGSAVPSSKDASLAWADHDYVIIPTGAAGQASPTVWRMPSGGTRFEKQQITVT